MIDLVVPTIGRPSLATLLESLARSRGPRPERVILVDDRPDGASPLPVGEVDEDLRARLTIVQGRASGPAAARNDGWRLARARWVAFVDDDVVLDADWLAMLDADLRELPPDVAASTGRVTVPLPADRRPTDWERNVAGLAAARWITADCAYRRADLIATGGFDERFTRAYREDVDLALRTLARGRRIASGERRIVHPVRPAPWWISLPLQAGNADDALMEALHGHDWYERADAPRGAFGSHVATVAAAATAVGAAALWAVLTARFAWSRIAPGPRTPREIGAMALTSLALPFVAVAHRVRGIAARRALLADRARAPRPMAAAVLFDRDGTLIADVPYNGDPALVTPMPEAIEALARLRAAGIPTAVITNQSGVALGRLRAADVDAVDERMEALLGPLGPVFACMHDPAARCGCRKPAPGLVRAAARALDVRAEDCVVIGDIGADVEAARAAGARAILVPTPVTRREEIAAAPLVAGGLREAVDVVLGGIA